nr:hypothetical protein [Sphingomonas sp. Y57]
MKPNFLGLEEGELDRPIYRIMPEQYVYDLFASGQNVLNAVGGWKDKFENFQLNLGGVLDGVPFSYSFKDDFSGQCWTRDAYSEAMWGIYASDPKKRFLRIRSTPRKLLVPLIVAHPQMPQDTCFFGRVTYLKEAKLRHYAQQGGTFAPSALGFAEALLRKRHAFRHEKEVRLLFFGDAADRDAKGLYRYTVDPHDMITQIMADPNRDRGQWKADKTAIAAATGFAGSIKRSKIYDPPPWAPPQFS